MSDGVNIVAINVGNTRVQVGRFENGELLESCRIMGDTPSDAVQHVVRWWKEIAEKPGAAVLMASVNDEVAEQLSSMIEDQLSLEVYRIGGDVPAPIGQQLDPETLTGIDRLLNAAAAYSTLEQACVIVDAGTAVTVDFVDGEGTFHGGAIAPGPRLQLKALHDHTAALPDIELSTPSDETFGRSTAQAMLQGVFYGTKGLVWKLVERYAEQYGAFPPVVATGGDAEMLFREDEIVDRIVPELTLLGIAVAARSALTTNRDDED